MRREGCCSRGTPLARLGPRRLSIDLSDSPVLDSPAVALLLLALRQARQCGQALAIIGLHPQPRQLLRLYGLEHLSELIPDAHPTAAGPETAPGNTAEGEVRRPSVGDPLWARPAVLGQD